MSLPPSLCTKTAGLAGPRRLGEAPSQPWGPRRRPHRVPCRPQAPSVAYCVSAGGFLPQRGFWSHQAVKSPLLQSSQAGKRRGGKTGAGSPPEKGDAAFGAGASSQLLKCWEQGQENTLCSSRSRCRDYWSLGLPANEAVGADERLVDPKLQHEDLVDGSQTAA